MLLFSFNLVKSQNEPCRRMPKVSLKILNHNPTNILTSSTISSTVHRQPKRAEALNVQFFSSAGDRDVRPNDDHQPRIPAHFVPFKSS